MPYRLRVTEQEVKQELIKMGFAGLSDDTVASIRKDLLKMIKSDLRKLKQERRDGKYADSSSNSYSTSPDHSCTCSQHPAKTSEAAVSAPGETKAKGTGRFLSDFLKFEERHQSAGESGFSESESSVSHLSEPSSTSPESIIPQRQGSAQIPTIRGKDVSKEETLRKKSKEAASASIREPKMTTQGKAISSRKSGLPEYPSRPDPVRLYHYYKAHWDKYKVPGEDPRLGLRWAVRSKLFYAE